MELYNIIDEEGYTWCEDKLNNERKIFGYWGHKKHAIDDEDWKRTRKDMYLLTALFLRLLMRMEVLKTTLKVMSR